MIRSLILLLTIAAPLSAQSTFPELLAERPDPKFHDKAITLGLLAGDWTWDGTGFAANGKTPVTDKGELHFHWILDGRAMQDVWMETERSDGGAFVLGTTIRFYDPKTDTWKATWVDPGNNAMKAITGRRAGDEIVFEGTSSSGTQFHWIFSDIKRDSFRWHAERLIEGKWVIYEDLRARRKPAGSRRAFNDLSTLAGEWKASGKDITVKYTLTADGSALMEEFRPANQPPMITMFSVDGDRIVATHYCSAGNQPQMTTAPIGNSTNGVLAFSLVRITGMNSPGDWHNTGLEIRMLDRNRLAQTWSWEDRGKSGTTDFEFERMKETSQ